MTIPTPEQRLKEAGYTSIELFIDLRVDLPVSIRKTYLMKNGVITKVEFLDPPVDALGHKVRYFTTYASIDDAINALLAKIWVRAIRSELIVLLFKEIQC